MGVLRHFPFAVSYLHDVVIQVVLVRHLCAVRVDDRRQVVGLVINVTHFLAGAIRHLGKPPQCVVLVSALPGHILHGHALARAIVGIGYAQAAFRGIGRTARTADIPSISCSVGTTGVSITLATSRSLVLTRTTDVSVTSRVTIFAVSFALLGILVRLFQQVVQLVIVILHLLATRHRPRGEPSLLVIAECFLAPGRVFPRSQVALQIIGVLRHLPPRVHISGHVAHHVVAVLRHVAQRVGHLDEVIVFVVLEMTLHAREVGQRDDVAVRVVLVTVRVALLVRVGGDAPVCVVRPLLVLPQRVRALRHPIVFIIKCPCHVTHRVGDGSQVVIVVIFIAGRSSARP